MVKSNTNVLPFFAGIYPVFCELIKPGLNFDDGKNHCNLTLQICYILD